MYKLCSLRKFVFGVIIVCAASLILVISKREYEAGLPIAIKRKSEDLKVYIYHNETEWINKTIPDDLGSLQSNGSVDIGGKDVGEHAVETLAEFKSRVAEFRSSTKLIYNRVPKCGSTAVHVTMGNLRKVLNYTLHISSNFMEHHLEPNRERNTINTILNLKQPFIFDRHVFFLNFTAYDKPMPLYINNIRDPVDRIASWYYFIRFQPMHIRPMPDDRRMRTYDDCVQGGYIECTHVANYTKNGNFMLVPFFCGHAPFCSVQSQRSLDQAKHNVLKHFAVVGLMEDLPNFFYTLEYLLPQYFKGALEDYNQNSKKLSRSFSTKKKIKPSEKTREVMRSLIPHEYEFYQFVKQRFYYVLDMVRTLEKEESNVEIQI